MAKNRTIQLYRGTTAQNDAYTGSAGELTMDTTLNEIRVHDGSTVGGHKISGAGTGRNIGDIFFTSRKDTGLNGAVACDGETYDNDDFVGTHTPVALMADGKLPYVSLAQYATLLSTNGSVGVFGWDGGSATTFRVPSLNDIFVETGTAAQVGDFLAPKIPNLKCSIGNSSEWKNCGDVSVIDDGGGFAQNLSNTYGHDVDGGGGNRPTGVSLDASRVSSVYDDTATTVQPQAVRYRAMVQLAISATDEAVLTCTAITAQVAANTSAINGADYVVESQLPTALNNYTWYRKYKSGWVEQGGIATSGASWYIITLPITMANSNYCVNVLTDDPDYISTARTMSKTTTSFYTIHQEPNGTVRSGRSDSWMVCGMAA